VLVVFFLLVVSDGLKAASASGIAVGEAFVEGAKGGQLLGHYPDGLSLAASGDQEEDEDGLCFHGCWLIPYSC
jgi:hypothetical protein